MKATPDPTTKGPKPPYSSPQQSPPGHEAEMSPKADHGEESYVGLGRLKDKATIITGGDSGIGRAVAIAFAREGADVLISCLPEEQDDAQETAKWVEKAGRKAVIFPADISVERNCQSIVDLAVKEFGRVDVLVNNAAFQRTYDTIEDIPFEELDQTFKTNVYAMFFLVKAALPHMKKGASIINTASIQADDPSAGLLAYAASKGAIANFSAGLAQMLGPKGIRVNSVAPGPIWTPLIPATCPPEKVKNFGKQTPLGRAGQPAELAPAYVMLATDEASYITGAIVPVTGGLPLL
jgi:NAD(P)-dependent dehydrogenase (short-subunit alcohol dehydrogenase family)